MLSGAEPQSSAVALVLSARHILPQQHAGLIAIAVELRRLHLDMLAQDVEAAFAHFIHVKPHAILRRGREDPVRPPSLREKPVHVDEFAVQRQARNALRVLPPCDFAHPEIPLHGIRTASSRKPHVKTVQMGRRRTPQLRRRNLQLGRGRGGGRRCRRHDAISIPHRDLHRRVATRSGQLHGDAHSAFRDVGHGPIA